MDNQNRYEETPAKPNPFARAVRGFGRYIKLSCYDFINSFRYNNMKLPAILVALPGIFLGFFLGYHSRVIRPISYGMAGYYNAAGDVATYKIGFDYTGLVLFALMLLGILNIFAAVTMSGKKNLGSVIVCTVSTLGIIVCASLYLYALAVYNEGATTQIKVNGVGLINQTHKIDKCYISGTKEFEPSKYWGLSITSVVASVASSVAGCILGFIFYDRTYEKADR